MNLFLEMQIFPEKKSYLDIKLNSKTYFFNDIMLISS